MSKEGMEWCIALDDVGWYDNSLFGKHPIFLKGERATKEKVFFEIPDITEEEYAKYFRPATEEEINGEFDWDGYQYILKKETKCMTKEEIASVVDHKPLTFEQMKEIEALYLKHDWEALRNQAAIAAMQGVMNFFGSIDYNKETIAKMAVEQADALIKQLKEKQL